MSDTTKMIPAPQGLNSRGSATATEAGPADAGITRDLIKAMAMDAGKSLCAYIEVMFPEVWHGQNSGFKISMKHHVYNDIMSLADLHDEAAIRKRLADNEAHRKEWVGAYRKMRRNKAAGSDTKAAKPRQQPRLESPKHGSRQSREP